MPLQQLAIYGLVFLLLFILLVFLILRRALSSGEVNSSANELRHYLADVQERFNLIKPHVLDYFNTLHTDGDDSLEVLNAIIVALQTKLNTVDQLLARDDKRSILEAGQVLSADLDFREGDELGVIPKDENMRVLPPSVWESTIEQLFQDIGLKVAEASATVASFRKPQRKRKSTIASLIEAGVKGVGDQARRISGTFKGMLGEEKKENASDDEKDK